MQQKCDESYGFCFPFVQSMPEFEPKVFDVARSLACIHQLITMEPTVWVLDPKTNHFGGGLLTMTVFPDAIVQPGGIDLGRLQIVIRVQEMYS